MLFSFLHIILSTCQWVCYNLCLQIICLNIHPPSAFGASPSLEALALEESKSEIQYGDIAVNAGSKFQGIH